MNTKGLFTLVRRWGPAVVVLSAATMLGVIYRVELRAWVLGTSSDTSPTTPPTTQPAATGEVDDVAYYTCSMHPSVKSYTPGTCPICAMDLTPVKHEELQTGTIVVDARRQQLIGVKKGVIRKESLVQRIRTVAAVGYDETRLVDVTLKYDGWIGDVFADYTGIAVRQGEPLFSIYSPAVLSAQDEYLDALEQVEKNPGRGRRLLESAKTRLLLWDITEQQLRELAKRGKPLQYVPYLAPATGTVIEKTVVKGSHAVAGARLYRIADLTNVWIEASVYEYELPLIMLNQKVDVTLSYLPEEHFRSEVSYIYPYLDENTRTGRLRISVPNPDGLLKPGMYADVAIKVPLGERLVVPEEAVLYGGESRVVFLALGDGRFQSRQIKVGVKNRDFFEVLDGLKEGDVVVTSGNFLIASESKLKSGVDKW